LGTPGFPSRAAAIHPDEMTILARTSGSSLLEDERPYPGIEAYGNWWRSHSSSPGATFLGHNGLVDSASEVKWLASTETKALLAASNLELRSYRVSCDPGTFEQGAFAR